MNTIKLIINMLEYVLAGYLGITVVYNLIYALAGLFPSRHRKAKENRLRKMTVLIPGYKEDKVILQTAKVSLQQDYPKEMYEVIVIADSFSAETLQKLNEMPIRVVEVAFENSTKSKALNKTMSQIPDDYDIAVILDADNLMANECAANADSVSKKLFEELVTDEERHFDQHETELENLKEFGDRYLALQSIERSKTRQAGMPPE